jgi:hypothetical protein
LGLDEDAIALAILTIAAMRVIKVLRV